MKWTILVGGYGAFLFDGDEQGAEEMRSHKARWERGIGLKRPADDEEVATGRANQCWNHAGFGSRVVYHGCNCDDENCLVAAEDRIAAAAHQEGSK